MAGKWVEVNDLLSAQYSVNENIRLKTLMLRSYLCGNSNAYILVKGATTAEGTNTNDAKRRNKKLIFKNNAPVRSCISKINITLIDNAAEDLDITIPIYNLLEYSENYSMTSGSLWNYYKDELNHSANENNDTNNYRINSKITTSKYF